MTKEEKIKVATLKEVRKHIGEMGLYDFSSESKQDYALALWDTIQFLDKEIEKIEKLLE